MTEKLLLDTLSQQAAVEMFNCKRFLLQITEWLRIELLLQSVYECRNISYRLFYESNGNRNVFGSSMQTVWVHFIDTESEQIGISYKMYEDLKILHLILSSIFSERQRLYHLNLFGMLYVELLRYNYRILFYSVFYCH